MVPEVESWADIYDDSDMSDLDFEDARCFEERLVPDGDSSEVKISIIHC